MEAKVESLTGVVAPLGEDGEPVAETMRFSVNCPECGCEKCCCEDEECCSARSEGCCF